MWFAKLLDFLNNFVKYRADNTIKYIKRFEVEIENKSGIQFNVAFKDILQRIILHSKRFICDWNFTRNIEIKLRQKNICYGK